MKTSINRFALLLCGSLLLCTATAQAQEKRVQMKDLPASVQVAVKEQSKGAKVRGLAQEVENSQTFYEAELLVNGHNKDVLFDATGKVVTVEEQVTFSALPAAVQAGLKKLAGKGRMTMIESITKDGALVAYEAHVRTGAKRSEVKVGPDGSPVKE